MIHKIEILFDLPVELSDIDARDLSQIANRICKANCPEGMVFWPAGVGQAPIFSQADALFLRRQPNPDAPESGEPEWDASVFQIDCCAREKYPNEK